ncbi:MFS transporter [Sphingomonas profundi]|uniref:MFS transporter n=1 Tax=Alterirhizorhabdus profundi TaxID=2681549 RepID=UPI0012E7D1CD|nr:MFS transporter [Sphingomonas profundi]
MPAEQTRGARRRATIALILTYANFAVLLNSVGTVILQSIASFGVGARDAAILEAFKDLPIAIVSFAVAAFLPRLGYRRGMMVGLAIVTVACAAMPLAPGFLTAKILFLAVGVSFALVKTATYAMIGLLTRDDRGHAALTNLIEGLFMVGVLAGYWLFSAFIDPADPGALGWLDVYWVLAAVSAANLLLLLLSPMDESGSRIAGVPPIEEARAMVALLARAAVVAFVAAAFLYVLIEQSVGSWLPTFNATVLHLPQAMSVQAASLYAATLAIGRMAAGVLIRGAGWLPVLLGCVAGMLAVILIVVPLAEGLTPRPGMTWADAPLATYAMPLIGLFLAPIYPTINSVILSSLPRTRHAAMAGLMIMFSALGGTTGSFITGRMFAAFGGTTAFRLVIVPVLLLALALAMLRRLARPAAAATGPEDGPHPITPLSA